MNASIRTRTQGHPSESARTVGVLLTVLLAWLVAAVVVQPIGEFSLNDDWVYALAVKALLDTGTYQMPSPSSANVGAQIYWGALFCLPFGFSFTALRFSTIVLGLAGIVVFYLLLLRMNVRGLRAGMAVAALAFNPFYFALSFSFMTDVPFVVLMIASVYFCIVGLQSDSRWALICGLLFSGIAILSRQLGLVLPLAFSVAYIAKHGLTARRLLSALLLMVAASMLHFGYQHWMVTSGRTPPVVTVQATFQSLLSSSRGMLQGVQGLAKVLLYTGTLVLPIALLVPWARRSTAPRFGAALGAVIGVALGLAGMALPSLPNVVMATGLGALTLRDTYLLHLNEPTLPLAAKPIWLAVTTLASAALFALFGGALAQARQGLPTLVRKARANPETVMLWTATAGYFVLVAFLTFRFGGFDRYVLPLLPLLLAGVLSSAGAAEHRLPPMRVLLSLLVVVVYAGFSVAATHDYLGWNRARMEATDRLAALGVRPDKIDGGYEFNGWHLYSPAYVAKTGRSFWWVEDDLYVIASGPIPGYAVMESRGFSPWLAASDRRVFTLQRIER